MPKKKHPGGRPTIMIPGVITKLEVAFALGCTDLEACFEAGISHQALYNYQKKHPKFVERKEGLKKSPITKARRAVIDKMIEDGNLAFKYLERKCKDEFGPVNKIEAEIKTEHDISPALADMFNKMYKGE